MKKDSQEWGVESSFYWFIRTSFFPPAKPCFCFRVLSSFCLFKCLSYIRVSWILLQDHFVSSFPLVTSNIPSASTSASLRFSSLTLWFSMYPLVPVISTRLLFYSESFSLSRHGDNYFRGCLQGLQKKRRGNRSKGETNTGVCILTSRERDTSLKSIWRNICFEFQCKLKRKEGSEELVLREAQEHTSNFVTVLS